MAWIDFTQMSLALLLKASIFFTDIIMLFESLIVESRKKHAMIFYCPIPEVLENSLKILFLSHEFSILGQARTACKFFSRRSYHTYFEKAVSSNHKKKYRHWAMEMKLFFWTKNTWEQLFNFFFDGGNSFIASKGIIYEIGNQPILISLFTRLKFSKNIIH